MLTVHVWLHIVDYMEKSGPVWAFWCWVMERFCSRLVRAVTSRKHPYASLNRRILELGTIAAIRSIYDLFDLLPPRSRMRPPKPDDRFTLPVRQYKEVALLKPSRQLDLTATSDLQALHARIIVHLATQWGVSISRVKPFIPTDVIQYGRINIKDGDTIRARLAYSGQQVGLRDATYIQYELVLDRYACEPNRVPDFFGMTYFGCLNRIVVIDIPVIAGLVEEPETRILLDIEPCDVKKDAYGFMVYSSFRAQEVVDGSTARALVGRIFDRGKWVIVKRSGGMEHAEFGDWDSDGHVSD